MAVMNPRKAAKPPITPPAVRRMKFIIDEDARFEECNGENRPLTADEYRENEYMKDGQPVSYADYLSYYGNPDRHVYLALIVQEQCPHCHEWRTVDSLWNIDFMDDDRVYLALSLDTWMSADVAASLPDYAGDLAREYAAM